jgi:hypothetical protein
VDVFGDPIIATAILDRLLHHSHVLNVRGDSYRLKEEQKAGLLKKAPVTVTEKNLIYRKGLPSFTTC